MKRASTLLLAGLLVSFTSLQDIRSFSWLEGTWIKGKRNGSFRLEIWEKKDDHTFTGKGLKVFWHDTTLIESIELYQEGDDFWYVPTVPDQNKGLPVPFKLISSKKNKYVFENPEHDFPQRIIYEFRPTKSSHKLSSALGDSLFVRVESMEGEGFSFDFIRI